MAKQGAKTAVPRLRFPGFEEPWLNDPLSKTLVEHKLKNASGRDVFSVSMESGVVNQVEHLGRSFAASDTAHYNLARRFDVVYTRSPLKAFPFGIVKQCKFDGEVAVSPLYGVFTPHNPYVGLMIEAYFESSSRSQAFLAPLCQKGAKNTIQVTNAKFLSGHLPLPSELAEQQKIAECLTSLDEVIAAQDRKVEALKAHKHGLMQQLFPREGETRPRLRFPEFRNAPEWENVAIEDLGAVVTGNTPPTSRQDYYGGDRPFVSPADISDLRFVTTTKSTLSEDGFAIARSIPPMSVLFVCIGSTIGKVAQNIYECATNQQINAIVANKGTCSDFIYYLMSLESGRIAKLAGKQAVPIINKSLFSAVRVMAPKFAEQQRIADCLASLDAQIAAESHQLAALKTHKQGLMQQLFPA